jgi:hypothetical protein
VRRWLLSPPLDAAADCHVLRNDCCLDLCAIADLEIRGADFAFDSAEDAVLVPLQPMLPTIDMSEPMQEAIPAFVVGSDLAHWSCCTTLVLTVIRVAIESVLAT